MSNESAGLKKDLGLFHAISIIGGIMIGSGIFYIGSFVMQRSGVSPGFATLAWVIAGVMTLFAGLSYAELGTAMPRSGGTYVYLTEAYGPDFGFVLGWTDFWVTENGSISALAIGFGTYMSALFPSMGNWEIKAVAIGVILLLTIVNILGVKSGGRVQGIFMIAKLIPILLIVFIGFTMGTADNPMTMTPGEGKSWFSAFALCIIACLWAFEGWTSVCIVAEELKNPQKDLPRAIFLGVTVVTLIYVVFHLALLHILPAETIAADAKPAALAAETLLHRPGAILVTVGALLAIFGSCNGCIMAYPREFYAMARDNRFFRSFKKVHPKYGTPINAQIASAAVSIALIIMGSFESLTSLTVFTNWIFYTMGVAAVIVMRKKKPEMHRPYKVWAYPVLPIISICMSAVILVVTLISSPKSSILGLVIPGLGFLCYHLYFKKLEATAE